MVAVSYWLMQSVASSLVLNSKVSPNRYVQFYKSNIPKHRSLEYICLWVWLDFLTLSSLLVHVIDPSSVILLLLPVFNKLRFLFVRPSVIVGRELPLECVCAWDEKENKSFLSWLCLPLQVLFGTLELWLKCFLHLAPRGFYLWLFLIRSFLRIVLNRNSRFNSFPWLNLIKAF